MDVFDYKKFSTKKELFEFLKENKQELFEQKKAVIKHADTFGVIVGDGNVGKSVFKADNDTEDVIQRKLVINSTNVLDSHGDVHIPGLWDKSIKDSDSRLLLQEHKMQFDFVISKKESELALAAMLHDPATGRAMEVKTTEPGIQVYTANSLTGKGGDVGKGGHAYGSQSSVCLETQHFPDSPNHPNFPTTVLNPGENYVSTTIYKFSIK